MPDQWPHLELRDLLSIEVFVRPVVDVGGGRRFVAFDGGTFEGARDEVAGTILEGGIDWQRVADGGVLEIDAHYTLLSDRDEAIEVRSRACAGRRPRWPSASPAATRSIPTSTTSGPTSASRRRRPGSTA